MTATAPSIDWMERAAAEAWLEASRRISAPKWHSSWQYVNSETGRAYVPHSEAERDLVYSDVPRYPLATGGEGGGKTVMGSIKTLERVRRGMTWIVVSPTLPHFSASTWPELRRWIPWQFVAQQDRYMQAATWTPSQQFEIVFDHLPSYPKLLCGGLVDSAGRAIKWEGPNVHGFWFDEARRAPNANGLKVLAGRARMQGPNGEPPQGLLTTTGGCPWITEFYGPATENDKRADFKKYTRVIQLLTRENVANLDPDYVAARSAVLTGAEQEIYLGMDPWGEIVEFPFLESIELWDRLRDVNLRPLTSREPISIALDAGEASDSFALVGTSRHPAHRSNTATRFAYEWKPANYGNNLDFGSFDSRDRTLPIPTLIDLINRYNVFCVTYDKYQLHAPIMELQQRGVATWFREFSQQEERLVADNDLRTAIIQGTIAHDGTLSNLRQHLHNADRKTIGDGAVRKMRLVKRGSLKIDLAVAQSMSDYVCRKYNL